MQKLEAQAEAARDAAKALARALMPSGVGQHPLAQLRRVAPAGTTSELLLASY